MKTIKLLLIATIVAFLSVSCIKDYELIESLNKLDTIYSVVNQDSTDTQCCDSTNVQCCDSINTQCCDSTNTENSDSIINFGTTDVTGTGNITTQNLNLSNFTEVELKKIGEVEIKSGSEYTIEISDYENLLAYAIVYLEGERLVISYDDSEQVMGSKLKIAITIPDKLSKCTISGSGNINIQSGFATDKVQLIVTGAGNILATNIKSHSTNIEMAGSGIIEAKGTTNELILEAPGSGTIKCKELISSNASCNISGVSTVFISVTGNIELNGSGVGCLTYYGDPVLDLNTGMLFSVIKG